jgi:ArsR family transcriptional regulator
MMHQKPRVLFLDATNSDRSQIAEALLRLRAGEMFEVCSAGLKPQPILEDTRRVLREAGVNPDGLRPKSVSEFLARVPVQYGITLGQRGEPNAPRIYPFAARTWHWDCPVPRQLRGPAARLAMLREIRDDLEGRIRQWLDSMQMEVAAHGHRSARRIA